MAPRARALISKDRAHQRGCIEERSWFRLASRTPVSIIGDQIIWPIGAESIYFYSAPRGIGVGEIARHPSAYLGEGYWPRRRCARR